MRVLGALLVGSRVLIKNQMTCSTRHHAAFLCLTVEPPTCCDKNICAHLNGLSTKLQTNMAVSKCCFLYVGNRCGLQ